MELRTRYKKELDELHVQLMKMGAYAEQAINNAITALKSGNKALAKEIIENDKQIDEMEKQIEAHCLSLMLKQQPVACDLRCVSTALKMVTDLERIGDHASDIAELMLEMDSEHNYNISDGLTEMANSAVKMLHDAIIAFLDGDTENAKEIIKRDDIIDDQFAAVKEEIVKAIVENPSSANKEIDILLIAKYLERIGDHAENICDWAQFNKTGEYKNTLML